MTEPKQLGKRLCRYCKRGLVPGPNGYGKRIFCDRKCRDDLLAARAKELAQQPRVIFRCEQCHHGSLICASKAEGKRFCSVKCRAAYRSSAGRIERKAPPRVAITCPGCGEVNHYPPGEAKGRKFCSRGCRIRHARRNRPLPEPPKKKPEPTWDFRGQDEPNIPASDGRRYSW